MTTLIFNQQFNQAKQYILSSNPDLNYVTAKGNTPLLVAIDTGDADMVEFLLDHGANPIFLDSRVNAPLIEAIEIAVESNDYLEGSCAEPDVDIVKLLLKHHAKVDLLDNLGRTPLSFAKDYRIPAYRLLLDISNRHQKSPSHPLDCYYVDRRTGIDSQARDEAGDGRRYSERHGKNL